MKKIRDISLAVFGGALLLLSVTGAILYFMSCKYSLDTAIRHFNPSPTFYGMCALLVITPILCLGFGIFMSRFSSLGEITENTVSTTFATLLSGILLLGYALISFRDIAALSNAVELKKSLLPLADALFAVLAAAYFFLCQARGKSFYKIKMWFSFLPVIWAVLSVMITYFDDAHTINDPVKALKLTLYVCILLFLCEDIRFYISRQKVYSYLFVTLTTVFFTVSVGVPNLILTVTKAPTFTDSTLECALLFALGLFALSRALSLPDLLKDPEPSRHDTEENTEADISDGNGTANADEASAS